MIFSDRTWCRGVSNPGICMAKELGWMDQQRWWQQPSECPLIRHGIKKPGGAAEYKVDQTGTMVINPISWDITPNNYSYIYIYTYIHIYIYIHLQLELHFQVGYYTSCCIGTRSLAGIPQSLLVPNLSSGLGHCQATLARARHTRLAARVHRNIWHTRDLQIVMCLLFWTHTWEKKGVTAFFFTR